MPTYNRACIIKSAIKSVLGQTFKDLELIIINDGSTDNTRQTVSTFKDRRIVYLEKEHGGTSSARNFGLLHAKAEYIAYLDDDEIYYPDHLKKLVKILGAHPLAGIAYSDTLMINPENYIIKKEKESFDKRKLEITCLCHTSSILHRKQCLNKTGLFDERLKRSQDWDMWLRISDFYKIIHLPEYTAQRVYGEKHPESGKFHMRVIGKRISKAVKEGKISDYINNCSVGIIASLIGANNINYANKLTNNLLKISRNYQTISCKGLCYFAKGEFKKASALFRESIKHMPKNLSKIDSWRLSDIIKINNFLAKAYEKSGKIHSAINICKHIERLSPHNEEARKTLARCYIIKKEYAKAQRLLTGIKDEYTHGLKGICLFAQKNYRKAIIEFEIAKNYTPLALPFLRYDLALTLVKLGQYKKANKELKLLLSQYPEYLEARRLLKTIQR